MTRTAAALTIESRLTTDPAAHGDLRTCLQADRLGGLVVCVDQLAGAILDGDRLFRVTEEDVERPAVFRSGEV